MVINYVLIYNALMSKPIDVWVEEVPVRFGSVDRSDRMTLWSIFDFFQEAAISHAANLGVGREDLARSKQAWILSRISIFAERRPAYLESLKVSTWPRYCDKLLVMRDYSLSDAGGNVIVRGRGGWIVLDVEKRRPLRPEPVVEHMPLNDGINAFSASPAGLSPREGLVKAAERRAAYSDIDYYGHVNNARYIQWIQDATDIDILSGAEQLRLDVNYLSEVLPGDIVELWSAPFENAEQGGSDYPSGPGTCIAYEGRRNGTAVFRAELRTFTLNTSPA